VSSIVCNSKCSADTLDASRSLRVLLIQEKVGQSLQPANPSPHTDHIVVTQNIAEAIQASANAEFDIVVCNVANQPNQLEEDVKQLKLYLSSFPLVLLISADDEATAKKLLEYGDHDFFYTPVDNYAALRTRMLYAIARHANSEADQQTIRHLQATSQLDSLTGLFNRAAFKRESERQVAISKRNGTPLSVGMIDIDFFKSINDKYGHMIGDDVLVGIGALFEKSSRVADIAYRYGGEEFCFLLPDTDEEQSYVWAVRLCKKIRETQLKTRSGDLSVTASIGVATLLPDSTSIDDALERADAGCIEAKNRGRDQVVVASRELLTNREKSGRHNPLIEHVLAKDVMSAIVMTISESAPLIHASGVMLECQCEVIPVLAKSGKLTGLLTNEEIVSHILRGGSWEDSVGSIAGQTISFPEETPFSQIWGVFQRLPIRRAVVTRGELPTGVVNRGQLLRRLTTQLHFGENAIVLTEDRSGGVQHLLNEVIHTAKNYLDSRTDVPVNKESNYSLLVTATQLQEFASQLLQATTPSRGIAFNADTCSAATLTNL
jgi:diguanylate cyclase (GGDEF)-like protein